MSDNVRPLGRTRRAATARERRIGMGTARFFELSEVEQSLNAQLDANRADRDEVVRGLLDEALTIAEVAELLGIDIKFVRRARIRAVPVDVDSADPWEQ